MLCVIPQRRGQFGYSEKGMTRQVSILRRQIVAEVYPGDSTKPTRLTVLRTRPYGKLHRDGLWPIPGLCE